MLASQEGLCSVKLVIRYMYIHTYPFEISITAFYDTNNRVGGKTNGTYGTHNKKGTQVLD